MKFIYNEIKEFGNLITKYDIEFKNNIEVEVTDSDIINKLNQCPFINEVVLDYVDFVEVEIPRKKRKYTKREKTIDANTSNNVISTMDNIDSSIHNVAESVSEVVE